MKKILSEYLTELDGMLNQVDVGKICQMHDLIKATQYGKGRIFVAGNGGSCATVNHFTCDFTKNAVLGDEGKFTVISLSALQEAITAYGNDDGYENTFKNQLRNYYVNENDVLICITVSGNSPNIVEASKYCKERGVKVISITGFQGGVMKEMSDVNINMPSSCYEQVEDIQSIVLHMITYLFKKLEN